MSILFKFETLKADFLKSLNQDQKTLLEELANYSSCIYDFLFRHPEELFYIYENLNKPLYGRSKLVEEALKLVDTPSEDKFITDLTYFKMKHFARIVAKDIRKKNSLLDLTEEYSYLADACFEAAYNRSYNKYIDKFGTPTDETTSEPVGGSVIALGKHGGTDLNYYSDVDVMYIYFSEGYTTGGITNREFFTKVFTDVNLYLTKRNSEGVCWNVDLDLRPEGKRGLLAYSLPFIENYYWSVGRTWERHMLIKARHAAGDEKVSKEFLNIITPFVYRKSISKEIIDEILSMKKLIEEHSKKHPFTEVDVKKSEGGIREIEFTVQIFQLLHGGTDQSLRERRTVKALRKLVEKGIIPQEDGKVLEEAYIFYRKLEHIIQLKNCIQTQLFYYKNAEEYAQKMGFSSTEEFLQIFENYRKKVKQIFESIGGEKPAEEYTPLQLFVMTRNNEEQAIEYLSQIGFKDPKQSLILIDEIYRSEEYILLSENDKKSLINFLKVLEEEFKKTTDKHSFLVNIHKFFVFGNIYRLITTAMAQNVKLIEFILNVAKSSDYITDIMSKDSELIDIAFSSPKLYENREDFYKEIKNIKVENQVDKLKKLKKIVEVLTGLNYLSGFNIYSPVSRVKKLNNILSNFADFALENLYNLNEGKDFAIYGLGKLGSREMNVGSDLDLIFVFKDEDTKYRYIKIPQKIVSDLTTLTKEGQLYQIDLRLRPYGRSGELSPSLEFYRIYFEKEARVWEILAWTKARYITGSKEVMEKFEEIIAEFIFSKEINKNFIDEMFDMRFKLESLAGESQNILDIKLGKGGITDIEFMVQAFYLKNKLRKTNILEGVLDFKPELIDDYLFLREVETRLRMVKGSSSSKLNLDNEITRRVASTFDMDTNTFWQKIKSVKEHIRKEFLKSLTKI
ncbi:MAG: glutamine-synthetase adenylyltransferase [Hydrogenothermaceae bacterium]